MTSDKDWTKSDLGNFGCGGKSDRQKILDDKVWVPCRICWDRFDRVRLTTQFCYRCHHAFCSGEHGSFDQNAGVFYCVRHDPRLASHDEQPLDGSLQRKE
jgi:hypothetical protein